MAKHPFFCPETSGKIALLQIKALQESSQSLLSEAAKESIRVSSALAGADSYSFVGLLKRLKHRGLLRETKLPLEQYFPASSASTAAKTSVKSK